MYGASGSIVFTPDEEILFDNLVQASKDFDSKIVELTERRAKLLKGMDTSNKVPNVNVVNTLPEGAKNVKKVIVSDFEGTNSGLATAGGFNPNKGSSYYLHILEEGRANPTKVTTAIKNILQLAKTNPENIYAIELSGAYEAGLYEGNPNITNEDVWKTISGALYNVTLGEKVSSWPSNLVIVGEPAGAYINSEGKGSFSKRKINRTQRYTVISKVIAGSALPINVEYYGGRFRFADGDTIADKISTSMKGWHIDAHIKYWNQWANENPIQFEELARTIGKRPMLDKSSIDGSTSTGIALARILNDKYYYGNVLKGGDVLENDEQVHNAPGALLTRVKDAGIKTSANFDSLLGQANVSLGFDLNSASLTSAFTDEDGNTISTTNTNRINKLQKAMGSNSVSRKFDEKSKVYLWGSTLYDFIGLNSIKDKFEYSVKPIIDNLMDSRNEILVGNEVGLDEVIRNYIESRLGDFSYVKTKTGYKYLTPGEIFEPYNYSFELKGNQLLFSGSEFNKTFNIDIKPEEFVDGFHVAPVELVSNILTDLDLSKSADSEFSDAIRAELVVEEQFYIQRYIAALSLAEAKIKLNATSIEEFDAKVEEYKKDTRNKFTGIYEANMLKVYNEDGSLKNISDLGLLAMAKSRAITNDYLKSIFEKPLNEYTNSSFGLLNLSRDSFESTETYKRILNSIFVTNQTAELISNAKDVTYFDLYNFVKAFSETKIYLKGNVLLDSIASEKLLDNKILGIKANHKYIITDSSRYDKLPNKSEQLDSILADKTNKNVAAIINTLMGSNPTLYNFFLKEKLLTVDPYNGVLTFNIGEEIYSERIDPERMEKQEAVNLLDNAIVKVLKQTFQALSPVLELSENDVRNNLIENRNFLQFVYNFKKPLNETLFKATAEKDLSDNFAYFKAGNVYNYNGKKAFIIAKNDINSDIIAYALLNNGQVLQWSKSNGAWVLSEQKTNLDNSSYTMPLKLANPQQVGTADALRLSNGSIFKATVSVEKEANGDYIATATNTEGDSTTEKKYIWMSNSATWKAITEEDLNSIYNSLGNINVSEGDQVKSLYIVGGLIANLSNAAEVKSSTTIVDGNITYKKDTQTGLWKVITGFKNPKIRFQHGPVTISKGLAKTLASKKVAREVIWELVDKLNKNTNSNIQIISKLDILADERFTEEQSDSAGFVLDGIAYINIDKVTLDTPMHELLGHVFLDNLKKSDSILYNSIIEKALKEEVVVKTVLKKNPNLKGEDLGHEVFSVIVGLQTQELAEKVNNLSYWDKFMNIVEHFFNDKFLPFFGKAAISKDDSLNTIIEKIGKDALYQKGSIFRSISNDAKLKMQDITNDIVTEEELIERFKNNNYIKEICL